MHHSLGIPQLILLIWHYRSLECWTFLTIRITLLHLSFVVSLSNSNKTDVSLFGYNIRWRWVHLIIVVVIIIDDSDDIIVCKISLMENNLNQFAILFWLCLLKLCFIFKHSINVFLGIFVIHPTRCLRVWDALRSKPISPQKYVTTNLQKTSFSFECNYNKFKQLPRKLAPLKPNPLTRHTTMYRCILQIYLWCVASFELWIGNVMHIKIIILKTHDIWEEGR